MRTYLNFWRQFFIYMQLPYGFICSGGWFLNLTNTSGFLLSVSVSSNSDACNILKEVSTVQIDNTSFLNVLFDNLDTLYIPEKGSFFYEMLLLALWLRRDRLYWHWYFLPFYDILSNPSSHLYVGETIKQTNKKNFAFKTRLKLY